MFGDILQPTHLIFILLVALIFLGPKRLPEAGRALGKGIRDFRGAVSGLDEAVSPSTPAQQAPATAAPAVPAVQATAATVVEPAPVSASVQTAPAAPSFDTAAPAASAEAPTTAMEFDMSSVISPGADAVTNPVEGASMGSPSFAARTRGITDAPVAPTRPAVASESRASRAEVEVADPTEYSD